MNNLSTSTILNLLNQIEESNDLVFDAHDILMLIGPGTDIKLLLKALAQLDNREMFYIVLRYTLFHHPEIAKEYFYTTIDFDALDFLFNNLEIKHPNKIKKNENSPLNFFQLEIKQEALQIIQNYVKAFKCLIQNNPNLVFFNEYWNGIPKTVFEYFEAECEDCKDLFSSGFEAVRLLRSGNIAKAQQEYKTVLNKINKVISSFYQGVSNQISIKFYLHKTNLQQKIEQSPKYKNAEASVKNMFENMVNIIAEFLISFKRDGTVSSLEGPTYDFSFKPGWGNSYFKHLSENSSDKNMWELKNIIITETKKIFKSVYGNIENDLKSLKVEIIPSEKDVDGTKYNNNSTEFFNKMLEFLPKI